MRPHLGLVNYTSDLRRLGWTDDDLSGSGSDALVAQGNPAEIAARLTRHLDAGADHVCLHLITEEDTDPLPGVPRAGPGARTVITSMALISGTAERIEAVTHRPDQG